MSFRPTASLENLRFRAEILRSIRRFFDERGLVEVQTPILSADTIVDRFVEPVAVVSPGFPKTIHGDQTYYLQTSPEFAMKRLLAAGMDAIYQIGPVFRQGDRGRFHNVEFTMLEWYRTGDDYRAGMKFLADFVQAIAGNSIDRTIEFRSYRDLFREHTEIDPHQATPQRLREFAESHGLSYPDSWKSESGGADADRWLDLLFSERIQPNLHASILFDFPATQSQLSQTRIVDDPDSPYVVAERFELFLNGIEIANGYHELLDTETLRGRFRETLLRRAEDGSPALPLESRLLSAMESGLPPCCGAALGIDRLLMILLNASSIDEVLAFPVERA